jgi:protein-disulfide isomerase
MRKVVVTAVTLAAVLGAVVSVSSWARADEPMTKTQGDAILDELRQIKKLLERQPAGPSAAAPGRPADERVKVGLGTSPSIGRSDAPIVMVEFTDYQCPFCQRFHMSAFEEVKKNYIDTGKIRYVSRDLPLPMHPNAMSAATAARCAGEQNKDKFWEMRHRLIVNANQLGTEKYNALADELKLDRAEFQACLAKDTFKAQIEKDMTDAGLAGIGGTPSFVIGRVVGDGVEGVKVVGAQPFGVFDAKLKEMLATR